LHNSNNIAIFAPSKGNDNDNIKNNSNMETISSINGMAVKSYIEKGMGKFVYNTIVSASNYVLSDDDIEAFKKKAKSYDKMKGKGEKRKFVRYAEAYMDMYEELKKTCKKREEYNQLRGEYGTSEGMHCDFNDSYTINKIYGIRYGI
jgi:hypothetical protein